MIALCPENDAKVKRLAAAGSAGVPLAEVGAALAISLALEGFARITPAADGPQRVIATAQGEAFSRRQAFA